MGKFARSWDLAKGSWAVLKADKELLILPVISFIAAGSALRGAASRGLAILPWAIVSWGEQVIASAGIGIVSFVAVLAGLPFLLLLLTGNTVLVITGIALFVMWIVLVAVVSTALSAVYQTALYHYASTGSSPQAFSSGNLGHAFGPKH